MKIILRIFIVCFALSTGSSCLYAQSTSSIPAIELSVPDSIIYSVFLDSQVKIEMVNGGQSLIPQRIGSRLVDVILHLEPMVHLRTTITVDSTQVTKLRIAPDAGSFTLIKEGNLTTAIDYTKPNSEAYTMPALEVEVNVASALRCAPPAAPEVLQTWLAELTVLDFEREKLKSLHAIFESSCLTVQQIEALISSIEDEQRRFGLLKQAYPNCFNQHDFDKLRNLLYLERNQVAFIEWLQNERSLQAVGAGE
jgi:hypothetical protein